ncbi:MAG: SWIM zinc finger domain-containing protein [Magnetococcales bacterium]|nr:SWIM zinc finger domain-containing protein [Magnetococcales bacterium]
MAKTKLTEQTIRYLASSQSFERGQEYLHAEAVSTLVQRGDVLTAEVEGSEYDPYKVSVHLHDGGVASADCSCPYDWGGYCKHIVAVLLSYVRDPDEVDQREPITYLLDGLDQSQLLQLLKKRLEIEPQLADWVEAELSIAMASSQPKEKENSQRRTLVDPEPIRRQAEHLLRGSGRRRGYWDDYESCGDDDELKRLVESVIPFLEAGDGRNALRILEPIADTFVRDWTNYRHTHDDEDMYLLFADLGNLFAEAILSADLSMDERRNWVDTTMEWQAELDEYGVDDGFGVATGAADQGWDDPELLKVMIGQLNEATWKTDDRWNDDQLTEVRLRVLERQGRTDEYLNLAMVAGKKSRYATMLVKLGRINEAVTFGAKEFELAGDALDLAKVLQEHEHHDQALTIGEAGLQLRRENREDYYETVVPLGRWLRDYAGGLGKGDLALKAAKVTFIESFTLEDYKSARDSAGDDWDQVRPELLDKLAAAEHAFDRTEIYLFEDMVDEAVQSIGDKNYYSRDHTLLKVAQVAAASHPDWVIRKCCKQAESIMDEGRAKHYDAVVSWLRPVHQAHRIQGREEEWKRYLEELISKHVRKYKLRPFLEGMRAMPD